MPPQHVEIQETILALKRALRREREAPSDQPVSSATNRGNKLKRGANYVHAGSLPYRYGSKGYKERIEHAGYQRYILNRNPRRYNEYGDELEESESDEEADNDADDENPYSDIRLEELLRPLTHPGELAAHPTLSLPFLDSALSDMVKSTEAQLRQERANLWRAKNLHRRFVGDESWMPCETVETSDDWDLFEPRIVQTGSSASKKRKRDSDGRMVENGIEGQDHAKSEPTLHNGTNGVSLTNGVKKAHQPESTADQPMQQENLVEDSNILTWKDGEPKITETTNHNMEIDNDNPRPNGVHTKEIEINGIAEKPQPAVDQQTNTEKGDDPNIEEQDQSQNDGQSNDDDEQTPPPPTRRITRALAAADTSNAATSPLSPTTSTISSLSSSLLQPAPLFLLPQTLNFAHSTHAASHLPMHVAHSGLPLDEIIETRRLLGMYIQKQEETIRGLEGVLGKLIKAKRMKDKIWEWSKAEGHAGEWSDGEDWVDAESCGLRPDELRKGRDEEEQEVQEEGRKGKRRRGRE